MNRTLDASTHAVAMLVVGLALAVAPCVAGAPPLQGNEPLRIGGDALGPIASPHAYKTLPYGAARVFGGARPDLFAGGPRGVDPSLNLYRYLRDDPDGVPVFSAPTRLEHPLGARDATDATILTGPDGQIYGFWMSDGKLTRFRFDAESLRFVDRRELTLPPIQRARDLGVVRWTPDGIDLVIAQGNGARSRPPGDSSRDDYTLYDGTGAFRGEWPYVGLLGLRVASDLSRVVEAPAPFSGTPEAILGSGAALAAIRLPSGGPEGVVAGARLGNLFLFPLAGSATRAAAPKRLLFETAGHAIRHPTVDAHPVVYPNARGDAVDLIVGGEGSLYYYRFTGEIRAGGHPVYKPAVPVLQESAELFAGTLPVPSVVDWDGDEALDLIVGNSEGKVLFFRNAGTNLVPSFARAEELKAGDSVIHVQPGYYGIQGPFEARWGYLCPTVADWNGDGLPDLLLSGATARHEVLLNIGTRTAPRLAPPRPLYHEGLELRGVWRVRPGVARVDGRMAYIIQDDRNALRLYWRIDDYNVEDGGLLALADGRAITSHITGTDTSPGQKGRGKFEVVDWDGDGLLDLLIGCAKRGSFPEPDVGLPWARRRTTPSLQVVYLRNAGTNAAPRYEHPRQLQFRGGDVYHGAHANSPVAAHLGPVRGGRPNLLIGMESGRIFFYAHDDITFIEAPVRPGAAGRRADGGTTP